MQSKLILSVGLVSALTLTSCGKLGKLSADNFTVTPSPLEAVGGQVPVTINGRFPEKYMKKKAVVTVTPVLRYADGQTAGQAATFQGEKVQGNNQEISYKVGGSYTMRNNFVYIPAMQQSELYLTFDARVGKRTVNVPEVKVADGVIATSALLGDALGNAQPVIAPDAYQYAIAQTQSAQIKYLIQQANIRTSELRSTSVQDFVRTLREIKADQKGFQLDNIEVSAYASPDGATSLNTRLASARERSATTYVKNQTRQMALDAEVDSKYTAEDWDGFQELVSQSNMQDKEVVLRVLSMYKDPEERETQIRNLSAAFRELADEILPELRRARLTINYNLIGRSDDEIQQQLAADASQLSVEEVLYAATLTENKAEQNRIYELATKLYPNDYRGYNNLAVLAYQNGNLAAADSYLQKAASVKDAVEVNANRALVALTQGNGDKAEEYLSRATTAANYNEVLGNLLVAKGSYAQAAQSLAGKPTNSAVLAQLLNKDYSAAAATLGNITAKDATTSYLSAIVAARTNRAADAVSALREAISLNPAYKARAAKDLEFASLFNDAAFQALVK